LLSTTNREGYAEAEAEASVLIDSVSIETNMIHPVTTAYNPSYPTLYLFDYGSGRVLHLLRLHCTNRSWYHFDVILILRTGRDLLPLMLLLFSIVPDPSAALDCKLGYF